MKQAILTPQRPRVRPQHATNPPRLYPACVTPKHATTFRLEIQPAIKDRGQTDRHTHTHPFNGPLSGTTQVSRYQKGTTNLDFTEARDSEWQWHQLGHMQVCTSLQTYNHASTPPLSFLQAGCPSCRTTNSVKAQKEQGLTDIHEH